MFYRLEGHTPVRVDEKDWRIDFKTRRVGLTNVQKIRANGQTVTLVCEVSETDKNDGATVSTVFLGIDHNYGFRGLPIVFETMVFGGSHDGYQRRYRSWDEADTGHQQTVQMLKEEQT